LDRCLASKNGLAIRLVLTGWCRLAAGLSATALHDRALASGVTFVPGTAFHPDPAGDSELRLCFTSVLRSTIDESVGRLARCVGELRLTA
jgi:2-aminoadipate transaminase